jgi:arabinan endo-1,5-alpha-L-arabinosidase
MTGAWCARWALLTTLALVALAGCYGPTEDQMSRPNAPTPAADASHRTVNGDISPVHDPSMVRRADGTYVLFTTHNGIEVRMSPDGVTWTFQGAALPDGATWADAYTGDRRELWAPDASYHNGRYLLYYAASSFGSNTSAIGLATSSTAAAGSWTDLGKIYESGPGDDFNAIDPNLLVAADGKWWLSFGSFWSGIKMIEIDPASGRQAAWNKTRYDLATRPSPGAVEAPFIYRHGDYYYLFVSFDFCCRGADSTYRIMVGRAAKPTGPYVDRDGTPMLDGGGTQLLATQGSHVGPGGQSVLHDDNDDVLVYHWYDADNAGNPTLALRVLSWDEQGWPQLP